MHLEAVPKNWSGHPATQCHRSLPPFQRVQLIFFPGYVKLPRLIPMGECTPAIKGKSHRAI